MAPAPVQCEEREKIAQAIRVVLSEILSLHASKVDAENDLDTMETIDKELEKAEERESYLLDLLHAHIAAHGCQRQKVFL